MRPLIQRQAGAHDLRTTLGLLGTHGNHTLGSQHNADVACRLCMPDPARAFSPGGFASTRGPIGTTTTLTRVHRGRYPWTAARHPAIAATHTACQTRPPALL